MSLDISDIRKQLIDLQQQTAQESPEPFTPPMASSPRLPELGAHPETVSAANRQGMAEALRQRSPQTPPASRSLTPEEEAAWNPAPANINRYLHRLRDEAEKINELYRQQEVAIRKFHNSVNGLALILLKHPQGHTLRPEQFCEVRDAALTTVIQDQDNRYILTAVDLDLTLDEQEANQTAATIRSHAQARGHHQGSPVTSTTDFWQSPGAAIAGIWHSLTATLENQSQITPLDILVWCGGGVIGRLALELALAAVPGLWGWVVAVTIGAVLYGLYRLLFCQRPDMAFVVRLFLALLGIGIGGQL